MTTPTLYAERAAFEAELTGQWNTEIILDSDGNEMYSDDDTALAFIGWCMARRTAAPESADVVLMPLTSERIIEIADKTRTAESRDGDYILPIRFARAIESEVVAPYAERIRLLEREYAELREASLAMSAELSKFQGAAYLAKIDGCSAGAAPEVKPIAWARKWHADGEKPAKQRNVNGRMAWPQKFKFHAITPHKIFPDDVPLAAAPSHSPAEEDK